MVVELALPAMLPGALVALHFGLQVLRPRLGYGSDMGGRHTRLDHRRHGGACASAASVPQWRPRGWQPTRWRGIALAVLALRPDRHRRRRGRNDVARADGKMRRPGAACRRRDHRLGHDDLGVHRHHRDRRALARSLFGASAHSVVGHRVRSSFARDRACRVEHRTGRCGSRSTAKRAGRNTVPRRAAAGVGRAARPAVRDLRVLSRCWPTAHRI